MLRLFYLQDYLYSPITQLFLKYFNDLCHKTYFNRNFGAVALIIDFLYYKIKKILVIESSEESIVKLKFDLAGQNTDPHKSDFLICGDSSSGSP